MKIVVLGGGQQGRVIAGDLAGSLPDAAVTVADVREPKLPALPNLRFAAADLSDADAAARLMRDHDLAVGALPSRFGFQTMRAAIAAKRNLVDVSFCAEDALALDDEAKRAGVTIVPDCGLAPGLSHFCAGRLAAEGTPDALTIYVGGVASDARRPYGYVVTWSLDDLLEEYVRPARIVRDGRPAETPAFAELERLNVPGAGEMEAFLSDGLRTALVTFPGVRDMSEKTLRWPGHVEAVKPLVASGRFREEFRARCVADPPDDLVAMLVRARRGGAVREARLVSRYDAASGLTAMARTTALTTAAGARMLASGHDVGAGVRPLERVATLAGPSAYLVGTLAERGVRLEWAEHAA